MAANIDKVEENESEGSKEHAKSGKGMREFENQMSRHNVAYKIKDKTEEGEDKDTSSNTE